MVSTVESNSVSAIYFVSVSRPDNWEELPEGAEPFDSLKEAIIRAKQTRGYVLIKPGIFVEIVEDCTFIPPYPGYFKFIRNGTDSSNGDQPMSINPEIVRINLEIEQPQISDNRVDELQDILAPPPEEQELPAPTPSSPRSPGRQAGSKSALPRREG